MASSVHTKGHRSWSAKRTLRRQLHRALAKLGAEPPLRDVSVHEARKELKRARATIRLLRDDIGDTAYRRANRRLRDAGRKLSRVRDAKVLLDTLAKLRVETKQASGKAELTALERNLRKDRQQARRDIQRPAGIRTVRRSVESVLSESRLWPAATPDSVRHGVERIYRKARKAFARAKADARKTALHETRKQTKYLGKALEVLAPSRTGRIAKRVKCANSIVGALGDDHDLAMLRKRLGGRSRSRSSRHGLLAHIERRREKLQQKAAKRGRRLYRRKAKAFVDELDLGARAH